VTRYELLDRIGVGGMAEIFRGKAVAAGGFEKPVAIKRILPHLSQDKRFVELLIAEAKVLSLLKHRNIVQIFDVGLGDDGQYFLVMEYVDGKDLGAVQKGNEVKRKRLPFDLALHIGAEICEALEHAHSAKAPDGKPMSLVHRDVSPSNVLLSRAGEVKLTDFGIAKRAEQEQTGTGGVRGKFAYISPEQARNEHIEPRSDVFSVAILIWEMVTNRRLFSGMGDLEALRAVREAQVQRPSEVEPRVNPDVDKLLMAALSRDPKRRPTAGVFGEQLRALRYSLDTTVGDPATELGKIIDVAEQALRESQQMMAQQLRPQAGHSGFDHIESTGGEHTVIRIRTADVFSQKDGGRAISAARQVIDRFEEEETRQAQLTGDQLRLLRGARRESSEMTVPPPRPDARSRRPTDEPTTARPPLHSEEISTIAGRGVGPIHAFDGEEATRLVAPTNRRTPPPERVKRSGTVPPPLPGMTQPRGRDPGASLGELPSTVHQRNPRAHGASSPPAMPLSSGPPAMPPGSMANAPSTLGDEPIPGTMHARNPSSGLPPGMAPGMAPMPVPMQPQPPMIAAPPGPRPLLPPQPLITTQLPPSQLQPMMPTPLPQQQSPQMMMQQPQPMMPQPPPQQQQGYGWGQQHQQPQMRPSQPVDRPMIPREQAQAQMVLTPKKSGLQPWMLVVGALVMAALAFAVTRAFISG
jgi:serine/threonine protein kinase